MRRHERRSGPGPLEPDAVLAVISEAYVAVGLDGRIVEWNPAAETTFGWRRPEAYDHDVTELIVPRRFRAGYLAALGRLADGDPGRLLERRVQLTVMHRDGHELPVETTLTLTGSGPDRIVHALAHDVSAALRGSRFTIVEAAVSRGLAEAPTSGDAAARVVEALGERMGWPVSELWLIDEQRQALTCAARHDRAGRDLAGFAVDELEPGAGLPGTVVRTGRVGWIPDLSVDTDSPRSRAAARTGLRVAVGVPIRIGARVLGALCVYGDRAEKPDDTLTGLLRGLAAHVGQYLERRRAEELAVDLARTKDEFLSMVTHELRNPLSVILGTIDLLDDGDDLDPGQRRRHLQTIARCADRLNLMTNDLLDLAQLESGALTVEMAPLDLSELLTESIATSTVTAEAKDLMVRVDLPPSLPVCGDPDRLRQVADNLLSNAVKYTPQGGSVTVSAAPDATAPDWVTWTVTDTGIGIPAEERPRLFRRFYRASTAVQARIPGTGLGLVITRTIIERHHGTIAVADRAGPGTTFVIRLPSKPRP
ncbi:ATP-binding protein [Actinoplanes sp. NPDC026670]|uniref:sensor histidine kinase n=1 Tax=Actinoplanes sp. NPDC026670 TaxID=3154700 RepID=UPI003402027F